MGLSDLYYKLEEKYYASLDWFDSKGIHVFYKFDSWLQDKGISSFPVMTILLLIFIAAIVLLILYFLGVFSSGLTVTVQMINSKDNYILNNLSFVVDDGVNTKEYVINSYGEAKVKVKKEVPFRVSINSSEYIIENSTFTAYEDGELIKVYLRSSSALLGSKVLKIFEDYDSKILFAEAVSVDISCTDSAYKETIEILSGIKDLTNLPEDCGTLEVSIQEYDFYKSYALSNSELEVPVSIQVPKGTIRISVLDAKSEPLSNVIVSVYASNGNNKVLVEDKTTSETGVVEFNLDAIKEYSFVLNHLGQEYSTLVTSGMDTPCNGKILENQVKTCSLTMTSNNVGKINLEIFGSGKPISNANIKVLKDNVEFYNYNLTDGDKGKFIYSVAELKPYRIVIDSLPYMIYDKEIMPSNTVTSINLEPVLDSPMLQVLVLANEDPVAKANVQLYKENNLILTKVTGADGSVYFDRLEKDVAYSVKVMKSDYSQSSEPILLNPRIENKLTVNLVVGKGNINVYAYNKQGLALSDLTAEVYDLYTNRKLGEAQLKEGLATIYGISADKTIYAKVVSDSGVGYSLSSDVKANVNSDLIVYHSDYSNNFNIENIGIFNLDGSSVYTSPYQVIENNEYYGLFLLNVPKGSFSESEVLFVGGLNLENANIIIKSAKLLNAKLEKGLTYTPPLGYADDILNKTQDDAVWAQLKTSNINPGTYLIKVNFIINSDPKSQLFNLGYRASLKSGSSNVRYPVDQVLGQSESSADKLGFYAELVKNVNFRLGNLNCVNSGCIEMSALDEQSNRTKVYDELYSIYNLSTDLSFKIISAQKTNYNDLTFEIASLNNGLEISNVNAKANSNVLAMQKNANKYTAKLNEFGPNVELNGNVRFTTLKSGINILKITIYNNKSEEIFTKEVAVTVDAPRDLKVEYLPSVIVPYVKNLGAAFVKDNDLAPVEKAYVSAYLNDVLIASGVTDYEGKYPLEIQKPSSGDVFKLKASAPGFNEIVSETKITENVLVPDVPEITYNMNIDEMDFMAKTIKFTTPLPNKLKIQRIAFTNNEFSKFLEVKHNLRANYEFEKELSLELSAKLTDNGRNLLEPKTINTNLDLIVTSDEINESWNVKIPVTFYIKMYDSLDSPDCLKIEVLESENFDEYSFNLINTCAYNEVPTDLYNANLFVEWNGTRLGEFLYDSKPIKTEGVALFDKFGKTSNFVVKFRPSAKISSGTSKAKVTVNADYRTNSGLQKIIAEKELDIIYSNLNTCLQISTSEGVRIIPGAVNQPIMVGVSPWGMGFNSMSGLFNQYMSAMQGVPGFNNAMGLPMSYNPMSYSQGMPFQNMPFTQGMPFGTTVNVMPQSPSNLWEQHATRSNTLGNFTNTANFASVNSNLALVNSPNSYNQMMMMQQMMGNGFGGMTPGMYLSPTSTLTITNTCAYDVDIQVGANAQIMVSPNSSNISVKGNSQITITSNSLPGVYNVNVLAGYNGNLSPFATIPVNVIDYAAETVQDNCFKIEGEPTINMSSFTKQHKQLKVYNYCFSKGIVFDDDNPVDLMGLFASEDVYMTNVNGQKVKVLTQGDEYAQVRVIKSPQIENSNTYGRYQYIEVMIVKNNAIQNVSYENYAGTKTLSDIAQSASVLRSAATALENNVNFKALMRINARIGYGMMAQKRQVVKTLTIKDLWNLLALAGAGELNCGNRECTPDKWSKSIADEVDYSVKYSQLKNRIPLNNDYWDLLYKDCFGSCDKVNFKDDYLEQTSNGITVKLTPHFKDRQVYFDVDVKGSGSEFKGTFDFGYTLKSYWHSETPLQMRDRSLKVKLTISDVDAPDADYEDSDAESRVSPKDEFCQTKFGPEWSSLSTYGFGSIDDLTNQLSFDYGDKTPIDCSKTFCDAEQLKKFLKDKFKPVVRDTYESGVNIYNDVSVINVPNSTKLVELSPSDVLDPISIHFLEARLSNLINDSGIESKGFKEFKDLVKDMPNLFLVVNTKACLNGTKNYAGLYGGKCYYNALKMSEDSTGESKMKNIFKGSFDLVFLAPVDGLELIGLVDDSIIYTEKVYLKPDNYEEYFKSKTFLNYDAKVKAGIKQILNPGVYLIYTDINAQEDNAKYLTILEADRFVNKDYENILKKFFYNLAVDPSRETGYTGQYGLCNTIYISNILPIPAISNCSSAQYMSITDVILYHDKNYLEFNHAGGKNYTVRFPNACKDKGCMITGKDNFKVNAPKDVYTLESIFKNSDEYCYSEKNNNVSIVYSGRQG